MEPTKVYYSIKEVRKLVDLRPSTLRYWEAQFEQLSPYKDEHGNRYYTEKDIELIKQIKFIRDDLHITRIEAIRAELKNSGKKNRCAPTCNRDIGACAHRVSRDSCKDLILG